MSQSQQCLSCYMIQEDNPVTQAPSPGRSCPIGLRIGPNLFSERTDAPILRRLRRHPLPEEGGFVSLSCSTGDTKASPVTLTIYSSPKAIPSPLPPLPPLNLLNLLNPGRFAAPGRYHNPQRLKAAVKLNNLPAKDRSILRTLPCRRRGPHISK